MFGELRQVFDSTNTSNFPVFEDKLVESEAIIGAGAGRVGLATAGFTKRLMHLGKNAYWHQDECLPKLGQGSLLLLASGSGETKTMISLAQIAKSQNLSVGLVTSNADSTLASMADSKVVLNCPNKATPSQPFSSEQPMTTIFEQALQIFFDSMVLSLMERMAITEAEMSGRHNVVE